MKHYATLLLVYCYCAFPNSLGAQTDPNFDKDLLDIFFVDSQHGWVVGKQGFIASSNDGGLSWKSSQLPTNAELTELFFITAEQGWIGSNNGVIYHTNDSGVSWQSQSATVNEPIIKLFFSDQDNGWALTENSFRQTDDGGTTWNDFKDNTSPEFLIDFVVQSQDEIWLLSREFLIRTLNGGVSLDTTDIALIVIGTHSYSYNSLIAWNDSTAEISGKHCNLIFSTGIRTCNGFGYQPVLGSFWADEIELLYSTGFEHGVSSSQTVDAGIGWIVGDSGLVAMTDSAGLNWRIQESGTFNDLIAISFTDTLTGWILGKNNLILNTIDGGLNWQTVISVNEIEHFSPKEYFLSQNYPNPFNPVTTISYSLPASGDVSLIVYNILGKEVARLVDGFQPAGEYQTRWNASNVSSGIYFYRLRSADFTETKKMALLK